MFNEIIDFYFKKITFYLDDFSFVTVNNPRPIHSHGKNTIEIHFIKEGYGKAIIDNKEYKIGPGSFTVIPEYIEHTHISTDIKKPLKKYNMYLTYDSNLTNKEITSLLKKIYVGKNQMLLDLNEHINIELSKKKYGYKEFISSFIRLIFLEILRTTDTNEYIPRINKHTDITFILEKEILRNYKNVTLESLSNQLYVSTRYIQRFIKKNYNKTFNELKINARMNAACNYLVNSNLSISEISDLIGYSSCEHFSFQFKKSYKLTPFQYRKIYK